MIDWKHKLFHTGYEKTDIQNNLSREEFVASIQHLTDTIRNHTTRKYDIMTTLSQLYLDSDREREIPTIYMYSWRDN